MYHHFSKTFPTDEIETSVSATFASGVASVRTSRFYLLTTIAQSRRNSEVRMQWGAFSFIPSLVLITQSVALECRSEGQLDSDDWRTRSISCIQSRQWDSSLLEFRNSPTQSRKHYAASPNCIPKYWNQMANVKCNRFIVIWCKVMLHKTWEFRSVLFCTYCKTKCGTNYVQDLRFSRPWLWRMPSSGMWSRVRSSCVNRRFGRTYRLHLQGRKIGERVLQTAATCSRWFLAHGFFYPEDGGDTFLRNIGSHKICTAPRPRRLILHNYV
jgi:hypothetical protein